MSLEQLKVEQEPPGVCWRSVREGTPACEMEVWEGAAPRGTPGWAWAGSKWVHRRELEERRLELDPGEGVKPGCTAA